MSLASFLDEAALGGAIPRALYLHVPFCRSRCSYCDFHSFDLGDEKPEAGSGRNGVYVTALLSRLEEVSSLLRGSLDTVFVGGGTPSALGEADFSRLLDGLAEHVGTPRLEWTVEANPESLSLSKLEAAVRAGVTRISLGIQSMDPRELKALGRLGTPDSNEKAMRLASSSGLELSVDLMSSVPHFPADRENEPGRRERGRLRRARGALLEGIDAALAAGARHVSIYDLVVEEGTGMEKALASGRLEAADPDEAYELKKDAEAYLARRGLFRYEVSNFAEPGFECRHNQVYWRMESYLGLGSGAVSTLSSPRRSESLRLEEGRDLGAWIADPDSCLQVVPVSAADSAFECLMMGLRTKEGVDRPAFRSRFGSDPVDLMAKTLEKRRERCIIDGAFLRVDDQGMDILNGILVDALDELGTKKIGGGE